MPLILNISCSLCGDFEKKKVHSFTLWIIRWTYYMMSVVSNRAKCLLGWEMGFLYTEACVAHQRGGAHAIIPSMTCSLMFQLPKSFLGVMLILPWYTYSGMVNSVKGNDRFCFWRMLFSKISLQSKERTLLFSWSILFKPYLRYLTAIVILSDVFFSLPSWILIGCFSNLSLRVYSF